MPYLHLIAKECHLEVGEFIHTLVMHIFILIILMQLRRNSHEKVIKHRH